MQMITKSKFYIFAFIIFLFLGVNACGTDSSAEENTKTVDTSSETETEPTDLATFWKAFQKDVASKNKEKVATYFQDPFQNYFAYIEGVSENMFDRAMLLKYYDYFFGACVVETIAKTKVEDLQKTDKGFQLMVTYPEPKDVPAGGGSGIFSFEKQSNGNYKITVATCAGGCGGECE